MLAIVECGQHCLRYENCRGLNYKFTRKDDEESVNCQLSNQSDASRDNLHGDWTFYTTMRPIVPLVSKHHNFCPLSQSAKFITPVFNYV